MAEYYPLLAKAVAGLPNSTPESRGAIYERARRALLNQLRSIQPPIAEGDIDREARALDSAIARLEAELAPGTDAAGPTEPAKPAPAPPPPRPTTPPPPPKPTTPPPPPPSPKPAPQPAAPKPAAEAKPEPQPAPARREGLAGFAAPKSPLPTSPPPKSPDDDFSPSDDALEGEASPGLRPRAAAQRPAAPQPADPEARGKKLWIVFGVVALVVFAVAAAAWKLRDRPEDIARLKPPTPQVETGGPKIVERVSGGQREPEPQQREQPPAQPTAEGGQVVPVAHRSALLVEAPEEAAKVKTYIGRVVWRLENAVSGPGQALSFGVRAEVDLADAGLQAVMSIQKNADATLSASHTIRIQFTPAAGGQVGGVKEIRMIEMRGEDMPNGDPLSGLTVQIAENAFLIGLMRGAAESTNTELMRSRGWFDLPITLANGKRAKVTFEKGVSGDRILNDAMRQWAAK
jgi:hypothetical protein